MNIRTLVSSTVVVVHFFLALHFKSQAELAWEIEHTHIWTHFFIAYICPLSTLDGTLVLVRFFSLGNYRTYRGILIKTGSNE